MSLARTVVRGVVWTSLTSLLVRGLTIIGNVVLLGWIAADDMGVANAAQTLLLSAAAIGTLGIGPYLLVHREGGPVEAFHAAVIHITLGVLTTLAVIIPGDAWGRWFNAPGLEHYVVGLCVAMMFDRVAHVPERLLVRKLRFVLTSNVRLLGEIIFSAVSVVFAYLGYGPISVIYGAMARSFVKAVIMVSLVPRSEWLTFDPIRLATLKRITSFGVRMWPQSFSLVAVSKWDNFIVSGFYGPGVLGNYNQAYNFADMPVSQVSEQMTDLLMPSFTSLAKERRSDGALRALGLNSLVMLPIGFGLGAVSDSLVHAMPIRPDWYGMIPMLSILCLLSVFRPISGVLSAYLIAQDRPGTTVLLEVFCLAVLLAGGLTIGRISPLWACAASMTAFGSRALLNMWVVAKLDQRPFTDFLAKVVPVLLACAPMVGAVLGVRHLLDVAGVGRPVISLIAEVITGAVVYVGMCFVVARPLAHDFIATLRQARRKKADA